MPRRPGSPRRLPTTIPTSPRSIAAHERASEALRLKVQEKKPYREIALILGYKSPASVYEAVQRLLKRMPQESIEEMRQMEAEKLDRYEKRLDDVIFNKRASTRHIARNIEVQVGKVMERRAKMYGLDAAERHEVEHTGPTVVEYFRNESQPEHARKAQAIIDGDFEALAELDPELAAIADGRVEDDEDRASGSPDPDVEQ